MITFPLREAARIDADELARLLTELGHATHARDVDALWPEWYAAGNRAIVAVAPDGALAGLVTTHQMQALHRRTRVGRITSLVVDGRYRRHGIGRTLVDAAERALAEQGCGLVEVSSNLARIDAHAFYEALGYARSSYRFAKQQDVPRT